MQMLKPPTDLSLALKPDDFSIFLAGSIEMGAASQWQNAIALQLDLVDGFLINPRRDDWDSSWEQKASNPQFREQVEWELFGLELASKILIYFQPETKSPISLLELGLVASYAEDLVIVCPDGFWRKGNIEIVCEKFDIPLFHEDNFYEPLQWLLKDQ